MKEKIRKEKVVGKKNEKENLKENEKNKEHVRHASTVAAALYRD